MAAVETFNVTAVINQARGSAAISWLVLLRVSLVTAMFDERLRPREA